MHTRLTGWLYRHDALYKSSLRHFHSHCNVGTPLRWHGFKLTLGIAKEVTTLSWYVTHNNDVSQCNYTDTARQFCTAGRHKRKNADIMCAISPHCVDMCVRYQVSSVFSFLITLDWPPFSSSSSSSSCKFRDHQHLLRSREVLMSIWWIWICLVCSCFQKNINIFCQCVDKCIARERNPLYCHINSLSYHIHIKGINKNSWVYILTVLSALRKSVFIMERFSNDSIFRLMRFKWDGCCKHSGINWANQHFSVFLCYIPNVMS